MKDLSAEQIYAAIGTVRDESSRKVLYIQFVHHKYFPEAYKVLLGHNEIVMPK